jgi:AraC family transcriptional regulator
MENNKRLTTSEDYKRRVDTVVKYIREHLDSQIDIKTLADLSAFSPFHFHRIAKAYLGESIGAYIIRVRIETGARLLRGSDMPIAAIAYKVGYETPSSFTRAFVKHFGISPIKFRTTKKYYTMTRSSQKQEVKLTQEIVELDAKTVLYVRGKGAYDPNFFESAYTQMWGEVIKQGISQTDIEHIALYLNDPQVTEEENIRYDICLGISTPAVPNGNVEMKEIEGGKFLKFTYTGEYHKLPAAYDKIYGELLAESGLETRANFSLEIYVNSPCQVAPTELITEIYVPVE